MSNNAQLATGSKYEMPKDALITLICSICFFAANAQTLGKRGLVTPVNHSAYSTILVTDAAGDEPLFGASVKIICKQDTLIRATQKLELGQIKLSVFFYENVPTDSVELRVSYIGYKTFVKKYSALDFKGTKRIQLLDDVMAISQIVVIGEQIAMVIKGDTTIYNALSFRTIEGDRFRELLKQLPGIEVKNNKIYASGEEIKRVYVDGRNFFGDNPEYVLSDLTANDVRSVKIYDQLSAEAKFLGDLNAKQERVMDVVTHSKPDVIQGGMATAMAGSSLDVGKYKNEDLRYEAAGNLFRNTERGNQRIDILLDRNIPSQSSATKTNWGTSPGSTQGINIGNTLRRGDTLSVYTNLFFKRNTQKNLSNSYMNYFPSHTYDLRNQNSFSNSLGDNYTIFVSNKINKLRRGNVFLASIKGELSHANHTGQNYTTQQIDNEQTILDRNLKGYDTGGTIDLRVMNSKQIGSLGFLLLGADFKYSKSKSDNMDVDTMASDNLMRIILNNNTGSNKIHTDVSATFMMKLSKTISLNLAYKFGYKYAKSRRISIDYIDNPSRDLDSVNSFNYTINSYRNTIESYFELVKNKFRLKFGPGIQIYDIASDEQLPSNIHSSHQYYSFTPSLDMSYMNAKHNLSLMVMSNADELSLEEIRNGLDATNPLVLFAGNPNLRQTKIYTASFKYEYTDVAHSSTYSVNASSNFAVDYATTKSTLFMEQTHLPMYDYTAQRGAQLNEIVNAEGCYGWNIGMWYSKKLAIDWTLKTGINYSFNRVPYFVSDEISYSKNQGGSLAVSAISGFSTKVNIELNSISELSDYNTMNKRSKQFTQSIRADIRSIILKHNTLTMSTAYYLYKNYSTPDVDSNDILTNVSIGRKFGKERKLELSIGVVDLFNRVNNVRTIFTNNYVTTTTNAYLGRYGYIRAMYRMGK